MDKTCVEIAVPLPVDGTFSYCVPPNLVEEVRVGCRALVPFGNKRIEGYILGWGRPTTTCELKEIFQVLDAEPLFPERMVPFFRWISEYYIHPLGQVIQKTLPGGLNRPTYKVAWLTEEGFKCLEGGQIDRHDRKILETIKENPGKRVGLPLEVLKRLERRGWVRLRDHKGRPKTGPLFRTFISARETAHGPRSLEEIGIPLKAKDEQAFLEFILDHGPVMLSELSKRFTNARYLVKKWAQRGLLISQKRPVYRSPEGIVFHTGGPPGKLSRYQEQAVLQVNALLEKGRFSTCLLFGVTGSGKTEVYLQAVKRAIEMGKQAIVMVPEIALAIYMEAVFRSRINTRLAVYHSGLSQGQRYDQWMQMVRGEVDVVIGARSALFSPLPRLGLIVVDEEHDGAYKQDVAPRYHGRDAAVARGRLENAVVVLGSGTPSVQSYANCSLGRYRLITMPERVEHREFPEVEIVDMKALAQAKDNGDILSPRLMETIADTLKRGKQGMLFLNRRGFFRLYICRFCGTALACPNCDVSLIYHLEQQKLTCHYCGYECEPRQECPKCLRSGLRSWGFGTERLEHELKMHFPGARIARMDTDVARRKGRAQSIVKDFLEHKIDILLGTQMITKGYDVPEVTLVGVVGADLSLAFPDFRAAERTFQLLSQVAGRAGRGRERGKVIIQTHNPDHYAIRAAISRDYLGLYQKEMELREQLGFPPFTYLVCVRLQGNSRARTEQSARYLSERLKKTLERWPKRGKEIQILGPAEAPIAKLRGKYRWQILIKSKSPYLTQRLLRVAKKSSASALKTKGVQLILDVDPYQMM